MEIEYIYCDNCNKALLSNESQLCKLDPENFYPHSCDFCDRVLCDDCCDYLDYSFHYCDKCLSVWCYFNGTHIDYPCGKSTGFNGECKYCGR